MVQSKAIMWHAYVASMAHPETEEFKLALETKNRSQLSWL